MPTSRGSRSPGIDGFPCISSWEDGWTSLRPLFEQTLQRSGLAPCLPELERLRATVAAVGGDAEAYARRCQEDPLARLGLLDLVPRPCARAWASDHGPFADLEERVLRRLQVHQEFADRPLVRVWCMAACRGEDAWRAAFALSRALPESERWDAAVLATDFSLGMLTAAQAGRYASADPGLRSGSRRQLLERVPGDGWTVRTELRRLVHFAWFDPAGDWPVRGPFEAIFTGDLLRLLAPAARGEALARISRLLRRRGTLYCSPDDDFPELAEHFPRLRELGIRTR